LIFSVPNILGSQVPCTLRVYDRLEELQFYLETHAQFSQSLDTFHKQCDALHLDSRSHNLTTYRSAFHSAANKLLKWISDINQETSGQPGLKFLTAIRILDPARVCLLEHTNFLYDASILGFSDVTEFEFTLYVDKLAPHAVIAAGGLWNDGNVDVLWSSVADRLPKLCVIAHT